MGSTGRALEPDIAAAVAAAVGLVRATCLLRVPLPRLRWLRLDDRAGGF